MNENNANWHIIPGNLSFFPFSAFPRTGPSMSLANILRHLWELSHGDSLSAGGSLVSGMAALPAAAASRGQQRGFFFPPLQGNDDTVSQWPRWVVSSWRRSLPTQYTSPTALHTHTSIFVKMRIIIPLRHTKPSAWTTEERADVTGHPFRQPETRRTSSHIAELWLRLFW